jgi:hypothetical protein
MERFKRKPVRHTLLLLVTLQTGCGSDQQTEGSGSLSVVLEPEPTIFAGLSAGEDVDQVRDGWTVTFDKYVLGVGHVETQLGSNRDVEAEAGTAYFIDLTKLPANGESLWDIEDLVPGRWTFGYEFVAGNGAGKRHDSVDKDDFARIQTEALTYLIVGSLTKEGGLSCPPSGLVSAPNAEPTGENAIGDKCYPNGHIQFEFAARAQTRISNCEQDGLPGFTISDKRRSTVAITIHGDHLFFNGFPEGGEGGIMRLAQIWADTDLNVDGTVSPSEYQDILLADMGEWDDRYQKGGAPLERLETIGDLVLGQLKTQGHMDGEGECSIDGITH